MGVRRRVRSLEERMGINSHIRVPIIWDGRSEEFWRRRAEDARARGQPIQVIRFTLIDEAESPEEAETKVAAHREAGDAMPLTVYRRGSRATEVLTDWDPGLPAWLRTEEGPVAEGAHLPDSGRS